ncbi:ran-binding protein 1 homolog c-like [Salvia miltiorrhiza]|uniref:ran-binding protein 1 homolog c-like n=1 Tax=Salvia miltiorrhiza TaxID=226208 RepID=UPI0025ABB0BA|nr:ran-binding protein 1 homolog c-like [Salvia miltiorrhiza]
MAAPAEPTLLRREEEEDDDSKPAADDEDTGAQVAPIVQLQEVAVTTGEENEDVLLELKSKLYRFDRDGNQWKERGVGTVKLLKHKETGKVRLVMRQNKTLKICANHLVLATMSVQEHQGNDKSCVWHAADFSDGELKDETFCIRFASVENCRTFKDKIAEIAEGQANDNGEGKEEGQANDNGEGEEGETAASLIEKLSVGAKDEEEKPESKAAPSSSAEKKGKEEKPEAAAEK